jgi:hypothetical protein
LAEILLEVAGNPITVSDYYVADFRFVAETYTPEVDIGERNKGSEKSSYLQELARGNS